MGHYCRCMQKHGVLTWELAYYARNLSCLAEKVVVCLHMSAVERQRIPPMTSTAFVFPSCSSSLESFEDEVFGSRCPGRQSGTISIGERIAPSIYTLPVTRTRERRYARPH